jgi:two-component system nitrate/nitrite sensor histidine kinase NarX
VRDVIQTREPILFDVNGIENNSHSLINSILAAPLLSQQQEELGVLLVSSPHRNHFRQRQISILQTIAGQIALVIQNAQLIAEIEYNTMIQERTRLAREIHDSLAQTLGFLKLQTAQIRNYLDHGDIDAARNRIDRCYKTLSETYEDARQSIDGLRVKTSAEGGMDWLEDVANNFMDVSGIKVDVNNNELVKNIQPEIHAQLIRIVQEALSNIRKHANAHKVWLSCVESSECIYLEIKDDGVGFDPEDVSTPSQYGLRGMRERAELIGAELQIESRPSGGTMLRVCVPLSVIEYKEVYS